VIRTLRARFLLASLVVFGACLAVMRTAAFARNPDVGYFGITFDLCITIPLIYYWLVVRRGHARALSIVPLFIACMVIARLLVPMPHRDFLRQLALLQAPLELAVVVAIVMRLRTAKKSFREDDDLVTRIELICRSFFGDTRLTRIVSGEVTAFTLGVFGWHLASPRKRGIASSTFHQRSGWGSIVACILVLIAAEGVGVHLIVQRWSANAAWFITLLDLWGAIWLLGDYQAFRLRPLVVMHDRVDLHFGFRWSVSIPRELIAAVEPLALADAERLRRSRRYLRLSLLDEPAFALRLRKPVRVNGAAGLVRIVTCIGVGVDDTTVLDALRNSG
jgi:hypothetical protein